MSRGSRPGERRGGRRAGVPNKSTLEREAIYAEAAKKSGLKLGKEIMQQAANYFFNLAAKFQPGGEQADEDKFEKYMKLAAHIACNVAPYESSRMQTVTIRAEPWDLTRLTDAQLGEIDRLHSVAAVAGSNRGGEEKTRH